MNKKLQARIYDVIQKLGGMSDILAIVGSINDTLDDEEAIEELDRWLELENCPACKQNIPVTETILKDHHLLCDKHRQQLDGNLVDVVNKDQ